MRTAKDHLELQSFRVTQQHPVLHALLYYEYFTCAIDSEYFVLTPLSWKCRDPVGCFLSYFLQPRDIVPNSPAPVFLLTSSLRPLKPASHQPLSANNVARAAERRYTFQNELEASVPADSHPQSSLFSYAFPGSKKRIRQVGLPTGPN